jgi:hypothetical protein
MPDRPRFFRVGLRPVRFLPTPGGGLLVLAMNWATGAFEPAPEYVARVLFGTDDEEELTEQAFIDEVEAWRARNLTGEGPVFALYSMVNAMEDEAQSQGRELTEEERALVAELRRRTYSLFEQEHPPPAPPGAS